MFYHGLSKITHEVLNATAGGIFLYITPNQAHQLLEDKVLLKLDWAKNQKAKSSLKKTIAFFDEGSSNSDTDKIMAQMDAMTIKMDAQYKELQSRAKQSTLDLDDDDMPIGQNDYNRDNYQSNIDDRPYDLQKQFNDFMKSQQSTNTFVKETFMDLKTQLEAIAKNYQASIQNLETMFDRLADKQSSRPSGSLPSNTQPNPRGSKAYQPPQARNEHVNVVFIRSGKFYNPPENPNDQQKETPINFDSDDEDDKPIPQPKTQPQNHIDVIDEILEEDFNAILEERSKILHSIEGTLLEEEIFSKIDEFMAVTANENFESEFDIEKPPFKKITINNDYKIKISLEESPTDLELKPLHDNLEYLF
nr:hypothetical protein [Tanacetum cinerariifolium]